MTRKRKVGLGIAVGIGVLALVGWQVLRPKIGSAPMAELKKLIDPRLLDLPEPTPQDEERWREFNSVFRSIKRGSGDSADLASASNFLLVNREPIARMHRLLDAGVSHAWRTTDTTFDFPTFTHTKAVAKAYAMCATGLAAQGEYTRALDNLGAGYTMLRGVRTSESSYIEHLINTGIEAILNNAAAKIGRDPKLPEKEAERLLAMIPESSSTDKELQQAIKGEFRGAVLSWIDDPKVRLKNTNLIQMVSGSFTEEQKDEGLFGNYNPYDTAKLANEMYLSILNNTALPSTKQDLKEKAVRGRIEKQLPGIPDFSGAGWRAEFGMLWYKAQMNAIGNSLGMLMLDSLLDAEDLSRLSFQNRTYRDLVRAVTAVNLYRQRHGGKLPDKLEDLRASGILSSVPHDYFAAKALAYDAKKGVMYSLGNDGKDDRGSFTLEASPRGPDYGFRLR